MNIGPSSIIVSQPPLQVSSGGTITVQCSSLNTNPLELDQSHILAYPNPALNSISISLLFEISSLEITNILGKKLMLYFLPIANCKLPTNLDVSFLSPGIYFLRAETDQGTFTTKFIKE